MKRIKVADLPEFDTAPYLGSETAIAAYLTDILEANDPALLASALYKVHAPARTHVNAQLRHAASNWLYVTHQAQS